MTGETVETAQQFVEQHDYLSWLGITVTSVGDGRAVLTIPDDEKLRNVNGDGVEPIHGGVVATLVDTASAFALRTTFSNPVEAKLTTTDLDVSYLRPATGGLRATATVVRAGGSMGVADVTVTSDDGAATAGDGTAAADDGALTEDLAGNGEFAAENDEDSKVAVGRATYRLFRDET